MKTVLVLGAGRSASALIEYLIRIGKSESWRVVVGDVSQQVALERVGGHSHASGILFDIQDARQSRAVIQQSDLVISMIPAHLHPLVAEFCLEEGKHLLTASYVSDEMKSFHEAAVSKGLLFLNECGLDPGIDHMSAKQVIDKILKEGGEVTSFESFTGGLIAPETDPENPWRYKFTWNPRNVVMAGQGTARFLKNGAYKYIPYQQLFARTTPVSVEGYGEYEGYANRDSLKYLSTYGLNDIRTMIRGTLRNRGFCGAWNVLVQMGCCDDTYQMENVSNMTQADFLNAFLENEGQNMEHKLCSAFHLKPDSHEIKCLRWSGLFSSEPVGICSGSPAQILEHILNKKWKLHSGDKDFIVMWHRFGYRLNGVEKVMETYLTVIGENNLMTAMAKTVGLPLGIAARLILQGKINTRGVVIPIVKEIYEPILQELKTLGIELKEKHL